MSKLRRPFLYDRYIFVTVNLLRSRRKLEERDFGRLAISLARMRQKQRFALTAWVFLPDHWHAIIYPPHPLSIANAMSDRSADVRPWRLHCNAVGSCFFSKDLQALRRAERRSAQGQRRWPLHVWLQLRRAVPHLLPSPETYRIVNAKRERHENPYHRQGCGRNDLRLGLVQGRH
jgi:REP element-mobilizing transposase RayT